MKATWHRVLATANVASLPLMYKNVFAPKGITGSARTLSFNHQCCKIYHEQKLSQAFLFLEDMCSRFL